MKNFEKYKSAEEAHMAWSTFCNTQDESCEGCPASIYKPSTFEMCSIAWMYLEAEEEEELLPCPFCGGDAKVQECEDKGIKMFYIECCNDCGAYYYTRKKAIENWNRRTDK